MILYPGSIRPSGQFMISMSFSLGIAHTLKDEVPEISIKWPNDIYAGDNKIAGILIENAVAGDRIVHTIAGAGINVNQEVFSAHLPNPVSMRLLTGKTYDLPSLLDRISQSIMGWYRHLESGRREIVVSEYHRMMYRMGQMMEWESEGRYFSGKICGVDELGCLRVVEADGTEKRYAFKEIRYLP